jgi:hypothetical protein
MMERKQTVKYVEGSLKFFKPNDDIYSRYTCASVFAIDHPEHGCSQVQTTDVLVFHGDGVFETSSAFYTPVKRT